MDTVYNALGGILTAAPAILVALAGSVLALLRWRRHPKASLLALVALLIYLLTSVGFPLIYAILPSLLIQSGLSTASYSLIFRAVAFIHYFIVAVALALLIAAVYAGRGAQPNPSERNFPR